MRKAHLLEDFHNESSSSRKFSQRKLGHEKFERAWGAISAVVMFVALKNTEGGASCAQWSTE
jgi:hypothetical protein